MLQNSSLELKKEALVKGLVNRQKSAEKQVQQAHKALEECHRWEKLNHEARLLQANLYRLKKGMAEIELFDWEDHKERVILLDSTLDPKEEVEARFQESKRRRRGIPKCQQFLVKAQQKLEECLAIIANVLASLSVEELEKIEKEQCLQVKKKVDQLVKQPRLPFREFRSKSGMLIWVGKTAKDNESLTFKWAHGNDWWLHASGVPGSHVLIRVKGEEEPDSETLKDAIQLALFYSKAKGEGEVCVTQKKYVVRLGKNTPKGKVSLSKKRLMYARLDKNRLERFNLSYR